jgi:hypothetical protein
LLGFSGEDLPGTPFCEQKLSGLVLLTAVVVYLTFLCGNTVQNFDVMGTSFLELTDRQGRSP